MEFFFNSPSSLRQFFLPRHWIDPDGISSLWRRTIPNEREYNFMNRATSANRRSKHIFLPAKFPHRIIDVFRIPDQILPRRTA